MDLDQKIITDWDIALTSWDDAKDELFGEADSEERMEFEEILQMDRIGRLIKEARIKRGLNQSQLGELIGVKKSQIAHLESGRNNVTIETMKRVFGALNAEVRIVVNMLDSSTDGQILA